MPASVARRRGPMRGKEEIQRAMAAMCEAHHGSVGASVVGVVEAASGHEGEDACGGETWGEEAAENRPDGEDGEEDGGDGGKAHGEGRVAEEVSGELDGEVGERRVGVGAGAESLPDSADSGAAGDIEGDELIGPEGA